MDAPVSRKSPSCIFLQAAFTFSSGSVIFFVVMMHAAMRITSTTSTMMTILRMTALTS